MALVPYLKWLGVALAVLAVIWVLTRRVAPPFKRLALRCLATSAVLMPQPLWAPGPSIWGTASLAGLGGVAALDRRAARATGAALEPRRLRWATYLLAALIVTVLVGLRARRFVG
jgi:hypothetical protein